VTQDRLRTLFVISILLLSILPARINAQNRIDTWTTDSGLPQNSVTGLTQTPDGYIWFTTNDGLVRFDGVQFTVFNRGNTPALSNNRVSGAFCDESGRLWIHTEDGGVLVREGGAFKVAMRPGEVPPGMTSPFFNDPLGGVVFYVNHDQDRSEHYRYQNGRFVPLEFEGLEADSKLILTDREGGLWVTNGKTVRRVKDGAIQTYDLHAFPGETYRIAYQDRQENIWLAFYDEHGQSLLRMRKGVIQSFELPGAPVCHLSEDLSGDLCVSVYKKGLYRIAKDQLTADRPSANALQIVAPVEGISDIASGYLCPDREGGIWIGTNKGLVRVLPQTIRVYSKKDGLPEDNVYPICEDRAGGIWAGIWESTLVRFENGRFKTVTPVGNDVHFMSSLFEDTRGRFWIGDLGSLRYLDKNRMIDFTEEAGFPRHTEFSVITQDRDGNLWFGTNRGLGRYSAGQATVFTREDGLPDENIVAFLQASDGTIWAGTRGGLASFQGGAIKAFTTADGLASNYIRSLYEDEDHALWIGSYDGGLTRFRDGRFTRFTTKDGLSSNGVFCILEDGQGWFWMNSNQGIFRVRKQELNDFVEGKTTFLNSISYNKQDGLISVEGNGGRQPAGIKARDGKLWFPTAQGIAVIDPSSVPTNKLPPPIHIEGVVIDRTSVEEEKLQSALNNRSEITLAPRQINLEIDYTGISFINPAQVKFKYKLEGLEQDWNEVGTRRAAYYSYLPPGEYTFHVIAANRDGVWNTEGASLRVRVFPPFYQTTWFVLLCVAAIGCIAWAAYRWRVHQVRVRLQLQFDERLSERTRIAQDLHDTLLQGFLSAFMQLDVANDNVSADSPAKPQLSRVQQLMAKVIEEGRNAVQGLRSNTDGSINLEQAFSRIQQELGIKNQIGFRVIVEGRPRPLNPVIRDEVYRTGREALVNAFRHSKAKSVEVEVEYAARHLRILVRDDGCGIDPEVLRSGRERHWGLSGMRERAERIGARLKVSSRAGAGTEIELSVPGHVAFQAQSDRRRLRWVANLYQRITTGRAPETGDGEDK
jgi:signal transduction histidine kinase/ligand-binding sensor domain-containing protein